MKKEFSYFKEYIRGKKVAVVGIGVSNIPLIKFLVKLEAQVTAFDTKNREELGKIAEEFDVIGVKLELGKNYLDKLHGFEVVFKTPSMRIDHPALVKAKEGGAYITSEMQEFVKYCPAITFGITGSDGKTTTTSLIYEMLKKEGYTTWVGGNIGNPLFSNIEEMESDHMVVLELSSFQLMTMTDSTNYALVTNLSPNHLDIHKDMDEYVDSKKNIYKYQTENDTLVLNRDNELTNNLVMEASGKVMQFSIREVIEDGACFDNGGLYLKNDKVCEKDDIKLMGMHNVENLLAAYCMVAKFVSKETMASVSKEFLGVEHRCEYVKEIDGVKYYNDSIATSPTRAVASLKGFDREVILIAGGYDKKIPFEPLAEEGYEYIKKLVLVGDTKKKIEKVFENIKERKQIPIYLVDSFEDAIYKAKEIARKGDIVTLSPACASFDMFRNFALRGLKFKEIIKEIK
ncbi:UDP-N-acetylmuramoyl-L-alanine--D-glutamate ligase [Clostridium sp. DL1XJH146]